MTKLPKENVFQHHFLHPTTMSGNRNTGGDSNRVFRTARTSSAPQVHRTSYARFKATKAVWLFLMQYCLSSFASAAPPDDIVLPPDIPINAGILKSVNLSMCMDLSMFMELHEDLFIAFRVADGHQVKINDIIKVV